MAFDLNAVRPRSDGKYSPELHRWLRREGRNKCGVFQRKIDPIFGEPTTAGVWSPSSILIGFADDDGWILGNSLREIVFARACRQRSRGCAHSRRDGCTKAAAIRERLGEKA